MTPLFSLITFGVAWLLAMVFAWAIVHGAQILRRQEVAGLIAAEQEKSQEQQSRTATVTVISPEAVELPSAA
jgi:UPF0716 family protein affecting phage T7 exclusion